MTLRQAAGKIRKTLLDWPCKVRARTVSFAGLGYGSSGFIDIECDSPLPPAALESVESLAKSIKKSGEHKIIISLGGAGYPFGLTLGR